MTYDDEILKKVKTLGVLGYTSDRVISILSAFPSDQVSSDLEDIESDLFKAYQSGFEERQMQVDAKDYALMKKEIQLADLEVDSKSVYYKLRKELFGI